MIAARLARPEIAALAPYVSAEQRAGTIRLNANESPFPPDDSGRDGLNRYPAISPGAIEERLARLFGVAGDALIATRGSSEAIDLLIRAFCRPYADDIVVTSPSFSMYRVYADIQGTGVVTVPLDPALDFALDRGTLLAACTPQTKLVFLCSPNNPGGALVPAADVLAIAAATAGRALVVVDEAYVEFSNAGSVASSVCDHENLVVLRTLSKAWGLAGARCGAAIGRPDVIGLLARIAPPYSFSSPVTQCVLESLTEARIAARERRIEETIVERERLRAELSRFASVAHVSPSDSNFLLVRFSEPGPVRERLRAARILVREFPDAQGLADCARITVGSRTENDQLLEALTVTESAK